MLKKLSVALGALALVVAIGFGTSQSFAGGGPPGRTTICHHYGQDKQRTITVSSTAVQYHKGSYRCAMIVSISSRM